MSVAIVVKAIDSIGERIPVHIGFKPQYEYVPAKEYVVDKLA